MRRRTLLTGGSVLASAAVAGALVDRSGLDAAPRPVPPAVPAGDERLERRASTARGRTLLLAETFVGFVRSVAAFSPAVSPGDAVFRGTARLAGTPIGLWCGRDDSLYANVRSLHEALPVEPAAGGYRAGRHNVEYRSTVIPAAFAFIGSTLTRPGGLH